MNKKEKTKLNLITKIVKSLPNNVKLKKELLFEKNDLDIIGVKYHKTLRDYELIIGEQKFVCLDVIIENSESKGRKLEDYFINLN